ncbi:MAG: class I SAM-dependent methyltransferase [Vulcanimicrobiota bacterium]
METLHKTGDHIDVCPWQCAFFIDNFVRTLFHNPTRLFKPYIKPGMTALDIGCGGGFATLGIAGLTGSEGKVIAADFQQEMLNIVKKKAEKKNLKTPITFHRCSSSRIGVEEKVDFALAFWMVHEVPDLLSFLQEIFDLLKPGGVFFIAEPAIHVSAGAFRETVEAAVRIGFTVHERPRVSISRAVVLAK